MIRIKWLGRIAAGFFLATGIGIVAGPVRAAEDEPLVVFFYSGDTPDDSWTQIITDVAQAAADDLGMRFEVIYSGPSRKEIFQTVSSRIEKGPRPDYALMNNYRGGAQVLLDYLNEQEIDSFLFNAGLTEEGAARIGGPRENLDHWLGQLIPDDERAGYDLANYLIARAREKHPDRPVRIVGIAGSYANTAVIKRVAGLERAAAESDDVELLQVVSARWIPDLAAQKYRLLTRRYGGVDAVWVANDQMAMGVVEEVESQGEDVLVGGMDWTLEALTALKQERLAASMGGHILDIGYALAILKRYDEGCDFADSAADASLSSKLGLMTPKKEEYERIVESRDWESLDFDMIDCETVRGMQFDALSIEKFFRIAKR